MTETPAEVVSQHVPEIKWPERVIICHVRCLDGTDEFDIFAPKFPNNAEALAASWCDSQGYTGYRILRVQPPVTRRVEIDWDSVERVRSDASCMLPSEDFCGGSGPIPDKVRRLIERHARIVEEPKP